MKLGSITSHPAPGPFVTRRGRRGVRGPKQQQRKAETAPEFWPQSKHKVPVLLTTRAADGKRRDPGLDQPQLPASEAPAGRPAGGGEGDLAVVVVRVEHTSAPHAQRPARELLRPARLGGKRQARRDEAPVRGFRARRQAAGGARVVLRPLHRPGCAFLLVLPARDIVQHRRIRLQELHGAPPAHAARQACRRWWPLKSSAGGVRRAA